MAGIDSISTPQAAASARAHAFEVGTERTGQSIIGAAGMARAISPSHALPAATFGVTLAGTKLAGHPRADALASHASGAMEGLVGGLRHGRLAHAATALLPNLSGVMPKVHPVLGKAAHVAGKALPAVIAGVGYIDITTTLDTAGPSGLIHTEQGRNGVINAIGGGLLLVPHPLAKLAGAGMMVTGIANDLGAMRALDAPH
jgi:hypothetical protein